MMTRSDKEDYYSRPRNGLVSKVRNLLNSSQILQTGDMKRCPGNIIEGVTGCPSWCRPLRPLFHILCSILFIHRVPAHFICFMVRLVLCVCVNQCELLHSTLLEQIYSLIHSNLDSHIPSLFLVDLTDPFTVLLVLAGSKI